MSGIQTWSQDRLLLVIILTRGTGYRNLIHCNTEYRIPDTGCRIQEEGFRNGILNTHWSQVDNGCWIQDRIQGTQLHDIVNGTQVAGHGKHDME